MKKIIYLILALTFASQLQAQNIERYMKYHDKGRMHILKGEYEKAVHYLDTAIQIMPYYTTMFQDRGYAYMQLKKYDQAVQDFDYVLSKKPYLNEVKLQRGMALYHLGEIYDAEADLLEVRKSSPQKSYEVDHYLRNIAHEKEIIAIEEHNQRISDMRYDIELDRMRRARHRENIIWNTVVPLAFWTTVFLTWD
jgi:tetratricopeptide (TPR) repeat protein